MFIILKINQVWAPRPQKTLQRPNQQKTRPQRQSSTTVLYSGSRAVAHRAPVSTHYVRAKTRPNVSTRSAMWAASWPSVCSRTSSVRSLYRATCSNTYWIVACDGTISPSTIHKCTSPSARWSATPKSC